MKVLLVLFTFSICLNIGLFFHKLHYQNVAEMFEGREEARLNIVKLYEVARQTRKEICHPQWMGGAHEAFCVRYVGPYVDEKFPTGDK